MRTRTLLTALVALVCAGAQAVGTPASVTSPADLNWLANVSDDVLVAELGKSTATTGGLSLKATVVRVLKGEHATGDVLWVALPGIAQLGTIGPGDQALWFLTSVGGVPTALPAQEGASSASESLLRVPYGALPAAYAYAADAPTLDKLINELRYATSTPDGELAGLAYGALYTLLAPGASAVYRHATLYGPQHFPDCPTGEVSAALDRPLVDRANALVAQQAAVPSALASALCAVLDPASVTGLRSIAASTDRRARACARRALRNIHSADALPALRAWLDEPDLDTQYLGLAGLALNANNVLPGQDALHGPRPGAAASALTQVFFPSEPEFRANPTAYLPFWKNWYPNVAPSTPTLAGGGASCHPPSPAKPCTLPVSVAASDANGDPLTYQWSACTPTLGASSQCLVAALGPNTFTVTADDGRGGSATGSVTLTGTNQTPTRVGSFRWMPSGRLPYGTEAGLEFHVSDDDLAPTYVSCTATCIRGCQVLESTCTGLQANVDVRITGTQPGLATVRVRWRDKWNAGFQEDMSVDIN